MQLARHPGRSIGDGPLRLPLGRHAVRAACATPSRRPRMNTPASHAANIAVAKNAADHSLPVLPLMMSWFAWP